MSKRLVRIGPGKIYPALKKLINCEISAVLENGRTCFGRLTSFTTDSLTIADSRDHAHEFRITELYEIVYDLSHIE